MGIVHPSGPSSHCCTCLGTVWTSQTSWRGASNTRLATISRSDGVVNSVLYLVAVRLLPFVAAMFLLLSLEFSKVRIVSFVPRAQEPPVRVRPLGDFLERRRVEL